MNNVYFACRGCKNYIDAGYRWPVSTLFRNRWDEFPLKINLQEVLSHTEYWSGVTAHAYLAEVLPAARQFLIKHGEHDLVFGDDSSFMEFDDTTHSDLEWLDEGSLNQPQHNTICLEPRYFSEHPALRYTSWEQVEEYCRQHSCGWSGDAATTASAKKVFLVTVSRQTSQHDKT